jgi:glycosyltransferase involved in cell wall biosynthesis
MTRKHTKYVNLANDLISIITPTWNRPSWLKLTLQSFISQTYSNWECIVQNDFGQDVENVVREFNDPRIKYFINDSNVGLSQTRNNALKNSSGNFVVLCDDDDGLYAETLEFRLGRIKKLNVDVVYSRVLKTFYDKTDNWYVVKGHDLYWDSPYDPDLILIQNIAPVNAVMASRKAHDFAGDFDVSLTTSEDWSHWVEMSRKYYFHETKILDSECSYRLDNSQMSGTRTGFTDHLPYLYKKWREYATPQNKQAVIDHQNNAMRARNLNPADFDL